MNETSGIETIKIIENLLYIESFFDDIMVNTILLYIGSIILCLWGISHLIATKGVIKGFGRISLDNKRIITMEWIMEGVSFLFIGILVILVTIYSKSPLVYIASAAILIIIAIVSAFTGARVKFLPYQLCPFVLTTVSIGVIV